MLSLDGVECGYVQSLTIGGITTNVTSPPARPTHHAKKHPGPPKSEDIEIQIGLSMAQPVYDWITTTWTGNYLRKSGSVIGTDFDCLAVLSILKITPDVTQTNIGRVTAELSCGRMEFVYKV